MARRGPARSDDQRNRERLAALRIRLQETAQQIRTAEDWTRCLQTAARLPDQSWANVLLISSRVPAATVVGGYEAWRSAGRQVIRNEKGIEVFAGARQQAADRRDHEDGERDHNWRDANRVTYIWNLSQTGGQPVLAPAAIPAPPGEIPPGLWDCLCWLARREGFAVEREPGCPADGTTLWAARRIRVLPGPVDGPAIWALTHQLGHIFLHNTATVPPGTTTWGCQGIRKAEADSVAFITCTRHGIQAEHAFASPQTWTGAPRGWTTLLTFLRGRGHHDGEIQAAGLARPSSRGTLIDHFRDRVMLPVHDERGNLAGFIGRARPGSGPGVPKYLNTPETSSYKKSNVLFGLHQARDHLARGATPVIAEGPFDANAITLAGQGRFVDWLLPAETAREIRRITGNQELATLDEQMQPVANPALPQIARALPADAAFQITRTAERLGITDYSDVLAEVANAATRKTADPEGNSPDTAPTLADRGFPHSALVAHVHGQPAATRKSGSKSILKPKQPNT